MPDDFIFSKNAEIIFTTLDKFGILRNLLDLVFPIYGKVCGFNPKDFRFYAIGQSHLDTAWNWTWAWTKKKIRKTFGNNIERLKSYPNYRFSASAPVHYEYFEKAYPSLFDELRKFVKDNRWDIVGGMYCEPDGNVPDGESLVRQRLYGQKYYLNTFNKRSLVAWVPDSFGFTWTYPQIFVKSGSPFFYTTKLTWNLEHEFPFSTFWWEGPDGSRVLAFNFKNGFRGMESVGDFAQKARLLPKDSNSDFVYDYTTDFDSKDRRTDEFVRDYPHIYGFGDGGAGPLLAELLIPEIYRRSKGWQFVKAGIYFKLLNREYGERLPVWRDELYLEVHRGCQTTLYRIKKKNRKAEVLLPKLEKLIIASKYLRSGNIGRPLEFADYPIKLIDTCWKKMLFNQFHDILPGSSIEEVYLDADRDYEYIFSNINKAITQLEARIREDQENNSDKRFLLFHPNNWAGDMVYFDNAEDKDRNQKDLITIIKKPSGIGFQTVNTLKSTDKSINIPEIISRNDEIEFKTELLVGKIHTGTGSISSLRTKWDNFEREYAVFDPSKGKFGLNTLKIFVDEPNSNDAWNIDKDYRNKEIRKVTVQNSRILQGDGSNPAAEIRISLKIHNSTAELIYIVHPELPYLIVRMHLDYQEKRKLLRTEFDTDITNDKITTGLAYGFIDRPTVPKQPLERGRWEFPGQKFISLSDGKYGLSVLCENRYGFDARGQSFGMSLKKAPLYGDADDFMNIDPDAENKNLLEICAIPKDKRKEIKDLGQHEMMWAIYPHLGDYKEAGVYEKFFALTDSPIKIKKSLLKEGEYIKIIDCDVQNVRISTLKPLFGSNQGLVVRLFEFYGQKTVCNITLNPAILGTAENLSIFEADLLEGRDFVDSRDLKFDKQHNSIQTSLQPYEIKTIVIRIDKRE